MEPSASFNSQKWREFIGIVVDPIKEKNQKTITVMCPEITPLITGKVEHYVEKIKLSVENLATAEAIRREILIKNTIEAVYLGSTNSDVPDVHQGEQVRILNYLGSDLYYWCPLGRDSEKRTTEHLRWSCANKKNDITTPLDDTNTYYFEIDTRYIPGIRLVTTKGNGEPFAYSLNVDTANGVITISDDAGTSIKLVSKDRQIVMQNSLGSIVDLKDQAISITAPASIALAAPAITLNGATTVTGVTTINGTTAIAANGDLTVVNLKSTTIVNSTSIQTQTINPDSHTHT